MSDIQSSLQTTHLAYSDESHYNVGRYRGVAVVSLRKNDRERIFNFIQGILHSHKLSEIGWKKLDGFNTREAAKHILAFTLANAKAGRLRVDILTWDTQDSRHDIRNRDDIANLGRMYYHVLNNALTGRWEGECHWVLYPDENSAMDWDTLRSCLSWTAVEMRPRVNDDGKLGMFLSLRYLLDEIVQCQSHDEPLIQLADLLAGLCIYSRTNYDRFVAWLRINYSDDDEEECRQGCSLTATDGERCHLLRWFYIQCRAKKLGVSLRTQNGLWTAVPSNPMNFWWYEVQHPDDKAPQKEKGKKASKPKANIPGLD